MYATVENGKDGTEDNMNDIPQITISPFRLNWTCPHCKHVNKALVRPTQYAIHSIVTCDCDDGGCDRMVVLSTSWHPSTKISTLNDPVEED